MAIGREEALLRIYLGESDHAGHRPLYEALVLEARAMGLSGATVLRGPMGYGHGSRLHTAKILRLSQDLPMVVELVDERAKLEAFLERVGPMLGTALAILQAVEVVRFQGGTSGPG